ncbi:MAG: hypothetical protein Q9224_000766 [Gallowayella concinna]
MEGQNVLLIEILYGISWHQQLFQGSLIRAMIQHLYLGDPVPEFQSNPIPVPRKKFPPPLATDYYCKETLFLQPPLTTATSSSIHYGILLSSHCPGDSPPLFTTGRGFNSMSSAPEMNVGSRVLPESPESPR